jgi:hypothetical protein
MPSNIVIEYEVRGVLADHTPRYDNDVGSLKEAVALARQYAPNCCNPIRVYRRHTTHSNEARSGSHVTGYTHSWDVTAAGVRLVAKYHRPWHKR